MSETLVLEAMERIRKQGECGMCGGPFARHRMIDAYRGMFLKSGETLDAIADWYGTEPALVLAEIEALDRLMKGLP